jgi:uncharacterized protein affecting Mg2+/Co2+ transport
VSSGGLLRKEDMTDTKPGDFSISTANSSTEISLFAFGISVNSSYGINNESQVKLLIINNAFCIAQRAIAQSKTGTFRGYGVVKARPLFQAGWSNYVYFYLSLFVSFSHLEFQCKFSSSVFNRLPRITVFND